MAGLSLVAFAVGLHRSDAPSLPWEGAAPASELAPEALFEEALAVLEGAYNELPDPARRIRDYIRAGDYGALRVDLRRLSRALADKPPGVPEALDRLHTLARLHS